MSSIWFPIIWDKVYGNAKINLEVFKKYSLDRQALHAKSLEFELYGKKVFFESEIKKDMKKILK